MEIVVSGRAGGKTHQLVEAGVLEKLRGGNPLIICAGRLEAENWLQARVRDCLIQHEVPPGQAKIQAKEMVWQARDVMERGTLGGFAPPSLYVDNLESVLAVLYGCGPGDVKMVTDNAPVRTPQGKRFEPFADNPFARLQL